jgi:hypothetical protein
MKAIDLKICPWTALIAAEEKKLNGPLVLPDIHADTFEFKWSVNPKDIL